MKDPLRTIQETDLTVDDNRPSDIALVEILAVALAYLEEREALGAKHIMGTPTEILTVTIGGFLDIVVPIMKAREKQK